MELAASWAPQAEKEQLDVASPLPRRRMDTQLLQRVPTTGQGMLLKQKDDMNKNLCRQSVGRLEGPALLSDGHKDTHPQD